MGKTSIKHDNQKKKKITPNGPLKSTIIMMIAKLEENKYDVLTPERELELIKKYKLNHDQDAYAEILYSNFRWIHACASNYRYTMTENIQDLIQEGYFGLMKAIENFDYTLGNRLNTYATPWIQRYMKAFINNNEFLVRISELKKIKMRTIAKKSYELEQELSRKPTIEELANEVNFPVEKVKELLDLIYCSKTISLDDKELDKELETLYIDNSGETLLKIAQQQVIRKSFNCLTLKELKIVCMYFGLMDGKEYTASEIKNALNIDRSYVYQVLNRALGKIRKKVNEIEYNEDILSEIDKEDFPYQALGQIKPTKMKKKQQKKIK